MRGSRRQAAGDAPVNAPISRVICGRLEVAVARAIVAGGEALAAGADRAERVGHGAPIGVSSCGCRTVAAFPLRTGCTSVAHRGGAGGGAGRVFRRDRGDRGRRRRATKRGPARGLLARLSWERHQHGAADEHRRGCGDDREGSRGAPAAPECRADLAPAGRVQRLPRGSADRRRGGSHRRRQRRRGPVQRARRRRARVHRHDLHRGDGPGHPTLPINSVSCASSSSLRSCSGGRTGPAPRPIAFTPAFTIDTAYPLVRSRMSRYGRTNSLSFW